MWERVESVLSEAFDRLGAVLVADLPGLVAMMIVLASTLLAAFLVRWILRRALARVGFDRRAREWGLTTGRNLEPHHEPSWLVARGAFWLVVATGIAVALAVLGASTTSALGLQLLGPDFSEAMLLRVGRSYERETQGEAWRTARPKVLGL